MRPVKIGLKLNRGWHGGVERSRRSAHLSNGGWTRPFGPRIDESIGLCIPVMEIIFPELKDLPYGSTCTVVIRRSRRTGDKTISLHPAPLNGDRFLYRGCRFSLSEMGDNFLRLAGLMEEAPSVHMLTDRFYVNVEQVQPALNSAR
jgi:hypothetical protein